MIGNCKYFSQDATLCWFCVLFGCARLPAFPAGQTVVCAPVIPDVIVTPERFSDRAQLPFYRLANQRSRILYDDACLTGLSPTGQITVIGKQAQVFKRNNGVPVN
ncbi:hypothetical Protein YC6258_00024 [Gynuella sunshinyii YC6258]|uniref:Uncharacterized protein n=1 Tax=Gynuella sunshinyii YC6258 TaxID=1445510 RepID=A0A0C5VP92_9GAMM|nr:hypothetical Protein YC6258_00024 [Gynuella sunshinyii YC6258]